MSAHGHPPFPFLPQAAAADWVGSGWAAFARPPSTEGPNHTKATHVVDLHASDAYQPFPLLVHQ